MAKGEGLSPEIEKYDAQWRKDPKSRVFAQLADAYRKSGFYDEAISVCEEGLKVHPQYASARVVLGRAYLDKGDRDKGVMELEEALKLSPDNLLALKTLGELYQQEGRIRDAAEKFKKAHLLNPLDKEIKARVDELKAASATPAPPAPAAEAEMEQPAPMPPTELASTEEMATIPPVSFAQKVSAAAPTSPAEPPPLTSVVEESKEEESLLVLEEAEEPAEELALSLDDLEEKQTSAPRLEVEMAPPVEILEPEVQEPSVSPKESDVLTTSTLGDLYLEQGFWDRAAEIYQKILQEEPDNAPIRAKLTEALAKKSAAEIEGGEPVYVIPEEMVPLEGKETGPLSSELLLEPEIKETSVAAPSASLAPPSPQAEELFSPEELAREAQMAALEPVEVKAPAPTPPGLPQEISGAVGDATLVALEQLLTGVRKERGGRQSPV